MIQKKFTENIIGILVKPTDIWKRFMAHKRT